MHRGPDVDVPDDMAILVETGCWGCSGYATGLDRVYRDPSGAIRSDELVNLKRLGDWQSNGSYSTPFINGLVMTPDASVMAIGVCAPVGCGQGGEEDWEADSLTTIFRSFDGGVTWSELGKYGPAYNLAGVLPDGRVVVYHYPARQSDPVYEILPDATPIAKPDHAVGWYPFVVGKEIIWPMDDGRFLGTDGKELGNVPSGTYNNDTVRGLIGPSDESHGALLLWESGFPWYENIGVLGNGEVTSTLSTTLEARIGWWDPGNRKAVISIDVEPPAPDAYGPLPAILDVTTGEYNFMRSAFASGDPPYHLYSRSIVDAVQIGPFARVTGTGSCLNIRADASASGAVLTCAADGVLLHDTGQTSGDWVSVMTPSGTQGWASAAFLER